LSKLYCSCPRASCSPAALSISKATALTALDAAPDGTVVPA
jgi:hypothetical protein